MCIVQPYDIQGYKDKQYIVFTKQMKEIESVFNRD